ncbi:hypothetical protein [Cytophaga aurantiaca]|uniref:hypothetical protein n=1 Tax=Cytophaga aurantiaca TaxID=29530 RepID=UPI000527F58D|nr:hypothetical protein [Cytophaga aurantiaca]
MKNKILISIIAICIFCSFTAQMIPTSLKITVRNELGAIEGDVQVTLYATKEDYEKSQNAVASGKTDSKGMIYFQYLKQLNFYISAEKGDRNNFGAGEKIDNLAENKVNKVTIIISE